MFFCRMLIYQSWKLNLPNRNVDVFKPTINVCDICKHWRARVSINWCWALICFSLQNVDIYCFFMISLIGFQPLRKFIFHMCFVVGFKYILYAITRQPDYLCQYSILDGVCMFLLAYLMCIHVFWEEERKLLFFVPLLLHLISQSIQGSFLSRNKR